MNRREKAEMNRELMAGGNKRWKLWKMVWELLHLIGEDVTRVKRLRVYKCTN